ncbi:hypothetical protein LR013_01670 [candidate division NPL-UPA2 bacterium]|nr:hypothetical protein [candidate division NPL-UPA2 bacterium]
MSRGLTYDKLPGSLTNLMELGILFPTDEAQVVAGTIEIFLEGIIILS